MSAASIRVPKIVLFGDSLVERSLELKDGCWGADLAFRLTRICDVVVRGFSGYNTKMLKVILPQLFTAINISDVDAIVMCLGANDSCEPESASRQHVPVNDFKDNLIFMIEYLKKIGLSKEKIILLTTPAYCHESYTAFCAETGRPYPSKDNKSAAEYASALCDVAKKYEIDAINLHSKMMAEKNWPGLLCDGLHFSQWGSMMVSTILWPHIAKRVKLCKIFPPWSEVDRDHPEKDLLS